MTETCRRGHPIRSTQDRYTNGRCRRCIADANTRYRTRCRDALRSIKETQGGRIE